MHVEQVREKTVEEDAVEESACLCEELEEVKWENIALEVRS